MNSSFLATLSRDAELKVSAKGNPFLNVSVWEYTGDKEQGSTKKETQFVDLTIFGKQAEGLAPYMVKGKQFVFHVDRIKVNQFQRKDGSYSANLKANVFKVEFVNSSTEAPQANHQAPAQGKTVADLDDDIPF